jgi:hypothetical protein
MLVPYIFLLFNLTNIKMDIQSDILDILGLVANLPVWDSVRLLQRICENSHFFARAFQTYNTQSSSHLALCV